MTESGVYIDLMNYGGEMFTGGFNDITTGPALASILLQPC
jgi:hypothetical protein